jgi:hypothetical protein
LEAYAGNSHRACRPVGELVVGAVALDDDDARRAQLSDLRRDPIEAGGEVRPVAEEATEFPTTRRPAGGRFLQANASCARIREICFGFAPGAQDDDLGTSQLLDVRTNEGQKLLVVQEEDNRSRGAVPFPRLG